MRKSNVKNYIKPKFLIGAAALMAVTTGCSREPVLDGDVPNPGATEEHTFEVKTTEQETAIAGDIAVVDETTTDEIIELDGDVAVVIDEETTTYPELAGELTIIDEGPGYNAGAEIPAELKEALADFSVRLFKQSVKEAVAGKENTLISPESVYLALGLLANGANGDTATELIENIAGVEDIETLNDLLSFFAICHGDQVNVANSVWVNSVKEYLELKPEYVSRICNYYLSNVYREDLPNSVDKINEWIKTHTNGMIDKVIDKLDEDVASVLVNAIAFEGKWAEQYEKYQVDKEGEFTDASGDKSTCTMLNSVENIYLEDENTTGFMKYYEGYRYAFMAMLPEEGMSLEEYIEGLDGKKLMNLLENRKSGDSIMVSTKTPKFKYDYSREMLDDMKALGMEVSMGDAADYSNMFETGEFYVDKILHKAHIELSETGTKAAAATVIVMKEECLAIAEDPEYYDVFLDRPFVYAIIDTETNTPMFIGSISNLN